LPAVASELHNAIAVIVCAECGAESPIAAERCLGCGAALDNAAARALVGQLALGIYRILDVVGKGGMSVVYKAQHRITNQIVALKILPAELAILDDIKARFIEEARALAKVEHPNIVRLYNFGEEGGRFVLAMQYVEGTTFERKIFAAGKLPWREAVAIARQVLLALQAAHGVGIIHRDIKPSNVLVRPDGSAMVMDFGIAKMAEGSARLTATGQTMGTVRYMSPEQVRGQVVDHRSDLYSVGATLYEAITGETPFDGSTHFEIMMKHLNETAKAPRARAVLVPEAVERALERALSKDVATRYQSATDFIADLDRLTGDAAVSPRPVLETTTRPFSTPPGGVDALAAELEPERTAAPRRRVPWLLAALIPIAAVALVLGLRRGQAPPPAEPPPWPAPQLVAGFTPTVDESFGAPELVRVLSARPVDAARLARTYVAARARFAAWASAQHGATVTVRPLNLVLATPALVCAAIPSGAPPDCASKPPRFVHLPKASTLYVLDDDGLETINLPEGTSQHLCANTPALLEKRCMKTLLPPYWDEVERKP
jgi:predicted Ser/Thr protein kinase